MNPSWRHVRLGDLIQVKHGWAFAGELFSAELTGLPIVINIGNFSYSGGFRFDSTPVREYRGNYPSAYDLAPGDILLVMTCQTQGGEILGIPARVPGDGRIYLHNQRLGKVDIRTPREVNADFLYCLFLWHEFNRELVVSATGTKILHTAPSRIEGFNFYLPPIDEQQDIARILGELDEKIELNRRVNQTLEAMARAIFKSWFLDFDFEPRGQKSPKLAQETSPRELPEGWPTESLADNFLITMGQSPPGETYNEEGEGFPFFQGSSDFGFRFPRRRVFCTAPSRLARIGDTLISVRAPIGDINMALEESCIGRGISAIRHFSGSTSYSYYAALFLRSEFTKFESGGTVFGSLGKAALGSIKCVVPPTHLVERFEFLAGPLDKMIENNERQSATLSTLRDTLLPKLLSGEIRVKQAEKIVGGAI
jgi:type I restriction enzyme, S subunit